MKIFTQTLHLRRFILYERPDVFGASHRAETF